MLLVELGFVNRPLEFVYTRMGVPYRFVAVVFQIIAVPLVPPDAHVRSDTDGTMYAAKDVPFSVTALAAGSATAVHADAVRVPVCVAFAIGA